MHGDCERLAKRRRVNGNGREQVARDETCTNGRRRDETCTNGRRSNINEGADIEIAQDMQVCFKVQTIICIFVLCFV